MNHVYIVQSMVQFKIMTKLIQPKLKCIAQPMMMIQPQDMIQARID